MNNMQTNSIREMTANLLKKSKRVIPVPFNLKLRDHEKPLYCEKLIRVIPGKRIVVFGRWDDKPVVAKLFFARGKAKKHIQRDIAGIEALVATNVPTPKLFYNGTDPKKRIHILVFEQIMDCCSLDLLWQEKTDFLEHTPLMRAATIELATQHVLGIVQRDLHLKNFLVTSKTIYTLDGGSIEQFDGPLSKKESLEHLGLFFAQLGAGTNELQQELFDLYTSSRGWIVRPADIELLQQSVKKWIALRRSRYQKKVLRNCTAFSRVEKLTSVTLYDRDYQSGELLHFLKHPDVIMAKADTQILKDGRSSTVAKIKIDNRFYVVKRYNMKGIGHWLRRCLRPSRASHSWCLAHHLRLAGISTAKPVAFIEKSFLGLRNKSYFVMEYIAGDHAGEYFAHHQANDEASMQVAQRIASMFKSLAELQITHGDLKITNILIHHERPVLIDLDGMREYSKPQTFKRAFKKEMQRFMKNWDSFPSVREMFQKLID
jgi:tRNA A-37 threonylcarbamoyl transferase component Bud32